MYNAKTVYLRNVEANGLETSTRSMRFLKGTMQINLIVVTQGFFCGQSVAASILTPNRINQLTFLNLLNRTFRIKLESGSPIKPVDGTTVGYSLRCNYADVSGGKALT